MSDNKYRYRPAAAEAALVEKMAARIADAEAGQAEKLAWDLLTDFSPPAASFFLWRRTGRSG